MAWAFIYGLKNGDPVKLITLYDYDANGCGHTTGAKDYKYIYWPNYDYANYHSRTVCTKRCPVTGNFLGAGDCLANTLVNSDCTAADAVTHNNYNTKAYVGKFCIADVTSSDPAYSQKKYSIDSFNNQWIITYVGDLYTCWWVCLVCAGVAFVCGVLYMFFIRC